MPTTIIWALVKVILLSLAVQTRDHQVFEFAS